MGRRKPRRTKTAVMNFRLRARIKDDYDEIIDGLVVTDRFGDAFGKGEVLEWFMATLVSATDKERAEFLERLQDGMERWVTRDKARPTDSANPGPATHGVGRLAPAAEVGKRIDGRAPRRTDRK